MEDLNDKATGLTLTAVEWNQLPSEVQNVIENTLQTLTNADLNQLGKGVAAYAAGGAFYTDSGVADAYVLSVVGSKQSPPTLENGYMARFFPGNANTGASTVNVAGLGVKSILRENGGAILPVDLDTDRVALVIYDGTAFRLSNSSLTPGLSTFAPRGYVDGLLRSNDTAGDVTNDVITGPGIMRDAANTISGVNSANMTKRIDAAWSAGTGGGGYPSGAAALVPDSWVPFFGIINDVTLDMDFGWDDNLFATNLLSDAGASFTKFLQIGWDFWVDDTTDHIRLFKQYALRPEFIEWLELIEDFVIVPPSSETFNVVGAPPGAVVKLLSTFSSEVVGFAGAMNGIVSNPDDPDIAPTATVYNQHFFGTSASSVQFTTTINDVGVDASSRIRSRYENSDVDDVLRGNSLGFYYKRGGS